MADTQRTGTSGPDMSVVIPTWNNARRLEVTLEALSRCTIPPGLAWEVVLVINNCTDDSREVADRFSRRLPLLRVEEPRQGLSRARNAGLGAAAGKLIVFADDDMRPCSGWIEAYWSAWRRRPAGFYFGGPIEPEYEADGIDPELLRATPFGSVVGVDWGPRERALVPPERLQSNWACPADVLRAAGGFDLRLGLDAALGRQRLGEEFELMDRLEQRGLLPWYLPSARVTHFVPARKCRPGYLADRVEAHGVYALRSSTEFDPARYRYVAPFSRDGLGVRSWRLARGPRISRVPFALVARVLWAGVRALATAVRRPRRYGDYFAFRFGVGLVRGLRSGASGIAAGPREEGTVSS